MATLGSHGRCCRRGAPADNPPAFPARPFADRRPQRGLSLIELLVGMAIGLLIAAAAGTFVVGNLRDNRALLHESRLMQDLRSAADMITRDLRRAGYWASATEGIWLGSASTVVTNPYGAIGPTAAASDSVSFSYSRDAIENDHVDSNEQFGFRLHNGALEMQLGAANWQAMTDSGTLTIIAFSVTPTVQQVGLADACPTACAPASATCPPRLGVRSLAVEITGRSASNSAVVRTVRSHVRVRTDPVVGACAV